MPLVDVADEEVQIAVAVNVRSVGRVGEVRDLGNSRWGIGEAATGLAEQQGVFPPRKGRQVITVIRDEYVIDAVTVEIRDHHLPRMDGGTAGQFHVDGEGTGLVVQQGEQGNRLVLERVVEARSDDIQIAVLIDVDGLQFCNAANSAIEGNVFDRRWSQHI